MFSLPTRSFSVTIVIGELMKKIILIGMPGAGKSTVGVLLAKSLILDFTDTDLIIQKRTGVSLNEIIKEHGSEYFTLLEEKIIISENLESGVIATGGSVIYGEKAMQKLKENGICVFLKVDLTQLKKRLGDITTRGIAMDSGSTLDELFELRTPKYEHYADITVDGTFLTPEECVGEIVNKLSEEISK